MAFAGIPDPHDCLGIDVLQGPSKHPPGLSLLRVSCKKPVTHLFQQKNSVGPELLQTFQEEGRQLDFSYTALLRAGAWTKSSGPHLQEQLWGHHPSVNPDTCDSDGAPAKTPELSLQETSCTSHQYPPAQFLALWLFSPQRSRNSRNSWACLAGMCNQPHRKAEAGRTVEPEKRFGNFRLAQHGLFPFPRHYCK